MKVELIKKMILKKERFHHELFERKQQTSSGSSPQKDVLTYPEICRDILKYPKIRISQGYVLWTSKDMFLDMKGYLPWI